MASKYAIRLSIGIKLTLVTAEGALANIAMQPVLKLGAVACAIGASANANLARHALLGVNPYGAIGVLL